MSLPSYDEVVSKGTPLPSYDELMASQKKAPEGPIGRGQYMESELFNPKIPETIGRKGEEGMSWGLAKYGRAAAGALYNKLHPDKDEGAVFGDELLKEYGQEKKKLREIHEDSPILSTLSELGGGLVPAAPSMVAGGPAVLTGAIGSALSGFTNSEESPSVGKTIKDAGAGGMLGGLSELPSRGVKAMGSALKESGERQVAKAIQLPTTAVRRLAGKGKKLLDDIVGVGRTMVREGVADNPTTLSGLYNKAAGAQERVGKAIGSVVKAGDKYFPDGAIGMDDVSQAVGNRLDEVREFATSAEKSGIMGDVAARLEQTLPSPKITHHHHTGAEIVGEAPKMSLEKTHDFIVYLDNLSNEWRAASDPKFNTMADNLSEAAKSLRGLLGDRLHSVDPKLAANLMEISPVYRDLSMAEGALKERVLRPFSKNKNISRSSMWESMSEAFPMTGARLGYAKAARGLSPLMEQSGGMVSPLGISALTNNPGSMDFSQRRNPLAELFNQGGE